MKYIGQQLAIGEQIHSGLDRQTVSTLLVLLLLIFIFMVFLQEYFVLHFF